MEKVKWGEVVKRLKASRDELAWSYGNFRDHDVGWAVRYVVQNMAFLVGDRVWVPHPDDGRPYEGLVVDVKLNWRGEGALDYVVLADGHALWMAVEAPAEALTLVRRAGA